MNGKIPPGPSTPPTSALHAGAPSTGARSASEAATSGFVFVLLYLPFGLAWALSVVPTLSYLVAWAGSIWILVLTISGTVKPLPSDRSTFDQVMRPIILTQIIFVFYNFVTSIFMFIDIHGYYYFSKVSMMPVSESLIQLTAEAQRYYVLAHAGVATGMLLFMDYRKGGEWVVRPMRNPVTFLLLLSGGGFATAAFLGGGLSQIAERASQVGLVASVLALSLAIPTRQTGLLLVSGTVYGLNMMDAFLSGFKENVLVMLMLAAIFMYPHAKKTVTVMGPLILIGALIILPTFANVFRSQNWYGTASKEEAATTALETIQSGEQDMWATNWDFLTGRISEIGLFTRYLASLHTTGQHYGTAILSQTASSIIPRTFWPDKPVTERVVMERVYDNGIVSRASDVSAKPQYVVDGYLSFGGWGVLLAGLVFGIVAGTASQVCERFFGGYFWGTGLVYTSFFVVLWKGNAFEYFFNTLIWGFVLLIPLFYLARSTGILIRRDTAATSAPTADVAAGRMRAFWAPQ
ncbi:exosortase Y-associated Wzy-like protein [Rubrivirga sp.]|uniref:exosortase Y-associated Wzy-like protein n=1 Tax=Rubrivirga sp. TaxID=1885344 RepID=UPI003B51FEBE